MNIKLRKLKETDLENLRRWRMSPEITKHLFTDPVITVGDQEQWYREMEEGGNAVYWIISFDDTDIGYAALANIDMQNKRGEPGIYIGETEYRGQGLGRIIMRKITQYAFEYLQLNKLYGLILSENYSTLINYLKTGWKIEGVLKDHVFKHNRFYDVYMTALLKADWMK